MDKKQISSVVAIVLAITFIGASVASSKIKTLKNVKAGSITNPYLANGAVNSAKIEDGSVSNSDLADNLITTGKIADGEVNTDDLASSSVTSAKISDGTIVNADINSSAAIAGTKIAPNFGSQDIVTTGDLSATHGSTSLLNVSVDDVISGTSGRLYVDSDLSASGLFITPSDASGASATSSTAPTDETCNENNYGGYELVDETDSTNVWLWICQRSGPTTYAWKMISTP